jgi:hypothetical protein
MDMDISSPNENRKTTGAVDMEISPDVSVTSAPISAPLEGSTATPVSSSEGSAGVTQEGTSSSSIVPDVPSSSKQETSTKVDGSDKEDEMSLPPFDINALVPEDENDNNEE